MMSACTVTSRPVVGSSATSSSGPGRDGAGDHHPLAHAAGELAGILFQNRIGPADTDHVEKLAGAVSRVPRAGLAGSAGPPRRAGRRWS